MLITLENTDWTSLEGLDEGSTYIAQAKEPFNAVWSISVSGEPQSRKDGITVCGSTCLKFKYAGTEKICVNSRCDLPCTIAIEAGN